jgi:hypothetical protein
MITGVREIKSMITTALRTEERYPIPSRLLKKEIAGWVVMDLCIMAVFLMAIVTGKKSVKSMTKLSIPGKWNISVSRYKTLTTTTKRH